MSSACLEHEGSSSLCNYGVAGSHAETKIKSFYKIFDCKI